MVLDEPNANLDDAGERSLLQAVAEMKDRGDTVVLITHRPGIIAAADLLMVMHDGRIVRFGTRDEVIQAMRPKAAPFDPSPSDN